MSVTNPMYDRYYMNPKALVRDKESGASKKVHAKPKKCGGPVMFCGGEYHSPISKAVGPNGVL